MSDDMNDLKQFRDFEDSVRRGLAEKADGIKPRERLDAILAAGAPQRRSALWIVGAAAVFVLVAALGIGYVLQNQSGNSMSTTAGAAPSNQDKASDPQVKQAETAGASTPAPDSSATAATGSWAMPVYAVVTGTSSQPWLLSRVYFREVATAGSADEEVQQAVSTLVTGVAPDGQKLAPYNYQQPWNPGTTATTTVADKLITVTLSQPGRVGLTALQQRIAVQSLVWTATAAAQQTVPVRVEIVGGRGVFATTPAGNYSRPASPESYNDLVPIWVDTPISGATVASPVTVQGEACVFEAQFSWELLQGTTVVKSGNARATSGCPDRGSYVIELGKLAGGAYTIRLWEVSMKDGSVAYETRVPFTVA